MAAPIVPKRLTKVAVVVKHLMDAAATTKALSGPGTLERTSSVRRSLVRATIELGTGPHRHILVASGNGEYNDSPSGIRTDERDLAPAMCRQAPLWLVIERVFTPADLEDEALSVDLFVDQPHGVDIGVWRNWDE